MTGFTATEQPPIPNDTKNITERLYRRINAKTSNQLKELAKRLESLNAIDVL